MRRGIFCGTFDPITLGHIDILRKAGRAFDKVYLAVSVSGSKGTSTPLQDRIKIARLSTKDLPFVEVVSFSGMLTDFCKAFGCYNLIRGIRNISDFVYENDLLNNYRTLLPEIEAFYFIPDATLTHISSTIVREISSLGGNMEGYVSLDAIQAVVEAYSKR